MSSLSAMNIASYSTQQIPNSLRSTQKLGIANASTPKRLANIPKPDFKMMSPMH